jgi:hypothetical protein
VLTQLRLQNLRTDHVRKILFSDDEDESDFNDSLPRRRNPKFAKQQTLQRLLKLNTIKNERTAERERNNFFQVFTEQMAKNKEYNRFTAYVLLWHLLLC